MRLPHRGSWLSGIVVVACGVLTGCAVERAYRLPPPHDFAAREIPFEDTAAFDALLETSLTNGQPVIHVLLDTGTPDWPERLNVWMKAYGEGGKVRKPNGKGIAGAAGWLADGAGTAPTEARRTLEGILDRVEHTAVAAASWWEDEQQRRRRIALLAPYLIDADRDPSRDNKYVIVFYNGQYD